MDYTGSVVTSSVGTSVEDMVLNRLAGFLIFENMSAIFITKIVMIPKSNKALKLS